MAWDSTQRDDMREAIHKVLWQPEAALTMSDEWILNTHFFPFDIITSSVREVTTVMSILHMGFTEAQKCRNVWWESHSWWQGWRC